MKFKVEHLKYLVEELKRNLEGAYIHHFIEYSKTDFVFNNSKNKEQQVIISLQSSHPFILFGNINDLCSSLASPFYLQLKNELEHSLIKNISLWNDDRIIAFEIESQNAIYEINNRYLVIELITGAPNLLLLDENKKILLVYKPSFLDQNRPLLKGLPYLLPNKTNSFVINDEIISFNIKEEFNNYFFNLKEKRKKDKYSKVIKVITTNIKSLKKKISNQEKDLTSALDLETFKLYGDLLLTYMYDIKEVTNPIIIEDIKIPLDINKTLKDNALSYYKKYQKSKNALIHLQEQLKQNKEELEYFLTLENQFNAASERELIEIAEELVINGYIHEPIKKQKKIKKSYEPYFIYYKDIKIGYGKNNLQNDYLSFTLANKNYYYLHIKDHPGSHIVIFDNNSSSEIITYAAELALFLGNLNDGDVILTKVKELKKTNKKGLVTFNNYQTIHISNYDKSKFTSIH